ncbi:MAG: ORF6N domain-containing protein [Bacteroidota bacterium]
MAKKTTNELLLPDEVLINKIYLIRNQKVMIDYDLAELYGVENKRLKEQVRRNIERFPEDFMFQLSAEEYHSLRTQIATLKRGEHSKYLPFAFTEHGVLMLSNVLNSKRAIQISIQIVRIYTKLREMLLTHKDMLLKLEEMEKKIGKQDTKIKLVFDYLNQFIKQQEKPRKLIGFRNNK